jgi:MFS transporter, SP family, solute carrier family 2 (myo-inositol transporter), member 13
MSSTEKSSYDPKSFNEEYVENVERRASVAEEITELSGIEATAASKAAWLISITVSIGGFLFGWIHCRHDD